MSATELSRHNFHVEFLLQVRKHDKVCDRVFLVLESDGTEKLRMPGVCVCVSNADSHEHTAGEVPYLISSRAAGRSTWTLKTKVSVGRRLEGLHGDGTEELRMTRCVSMSS